MPGPETTDPTVGIPGAEWRDGVLHLTLPPEDFDAMMEAVTNPPVPSPEAREAMRRSREMFGE